MVGHGNGGHLVFNGRVDQPVYLAGTVKEAVTGVQMEVDKGVIFHGEDGIQLRRQNEAFLAGISPHRETRKLGLICRSFLATLRGMRKGCQVGRKRFE
jgi:hypothetical protein